MSQSKRLRTPAGSARARRRASKVIARKFDPSVRTRKGRRKAYRRKVMAEYAADKNNPWRGAAFGNENLRRVSRSDPDAGMTSLAAALKSIKIGANISDPELGSRLAKSGVSRIIDILTDETARQKYLKAYSASDNGKRFPDPSSIAKDPHVRRTLGRQARALRELLSLADHKTPFVKKAALEALTTLVNEDVVLFRYNQKFINLIRHKLTKAL